MRPFAWIGSLFAAFLLVVLSGCGGSGASTSSLTLTPNTATVAVGQTQQFLAIPTGGTDPVVWSATGGTVSASGLYTASNTPGDYVVTASLRDNSGIRASANVKVVPGVEVTITSPEIQPRVLTRSQLTLRATVTGSANTGVTWSVAQGASGGSIDAAGVYTAPATSGTYTVVARSAVDPTKRAEKQIVVSGSANVRLTIAQMGEIVLELNAVQAPLTAANFVTLVNKGFYDGIRFHRYEPGFVIQAGDPNSKTLPLDDPSMGTGGPGYTIPFETNNLTHTQYALAMASTGARTGGGSQFYITLAPQPSLDGNYAVFGRVISGQNVVDMIGVGPTISRAVVEAP